MPSPTTMYVKLILATMFWGGTFVAGRIASQSIGPSLGAFGRFLIASLFLMAVLWVRERQWVRLKLTQLVLIVVASLTGIIAYNLFFFNGLRLIEANRASLIVALNPIVIMLTAAVLGMERLTVQRVLGIVIALVGAAVVLTRGDLRAIGGSIGKGELMIGGCVLSWSAYTLIGRVIVRQMSPLSGTTYACMAGCAGLLVPASAHMSGVLDTNLAALLAVAYLGICGTGLAFVWYYDGLKAIGPTRAGIFINMVPGWGIVFSAWLLREEILATTLFGGLVIIAGVVLTNLSRRQVGLRGSLSRSAQGQQ